LVWKLYEKYFELKVFWLDDAYVGVLARYINAQFINSSINWYLDVKKISEDLRPFNYLFIRYIESNNEYGKVWELIKK